MKNLVLLIVLILFFNCSKKTEQKLEKPPRELPRNVTKTKKKKVSSKIIVDVDSINDKNTIKFLQLYGKENKETIVAIDTNLGTIKIRLYKDTPLHRASFIFLTKTGYFNTTSFHRVVKDFIVQGGNSDHPLTRKLRIKYKSYRIPAEILSHRKHKYGALAAARGWDNNPNKLSSPFEFYIIQRKSGSHYLNGEHTIFGEVISGMDVVNKIAQLETDAKEWPIKDVTMRTSVLK